jgi:hypothetical protein
MLLKIRIKGQQEEEDDVSNYRINLRTQKNNGN